MTRPLRIEYEGAVYHVTARGNERRKIFFTKRDFQKFKEFLAAGESKYGFLLHAYVLMTTQAERGKKRRGLSAEKIYRGHEYRDRRTIWRHQLFGGYQNYAKLFKVDGRRQGAAGSRKESLGK